MADFSKAMACVGITGGMNTTTASDLPSESGLRATLIWFASCVINYLHITVQMFFEETVTLATSPGSLFSIPLQFFSSMLGLCAMEVGRRGSPSGQSRRYRSLALAAVMMGVSTLAGQTATMPYYPSHGLLGVRAAAQISRRPQSLLSLFAPPF